MKLKQNDRTLNDLILIYAHINPSSAALLRCNSNIDTKPRSHRHSTFDPLLPMSTTLLLSVAADWIRLNYFDTNDRFFFISVSFLFSRIYVCAFCILANVNRLMQIGLKQKQNFKNWIKSRWSASSCKTIWQKIRAKFVLSLDWMLEHWDSIWNRRNFASLSKNLNCFALPIPSNDFDF